MFEWPVSHDDEVYAIIFPKILFPLNNIIFSSSIFLTIVIAYERYSCVCRPHQYRQSNLGTSITRKVVTYLLPTILFSTALNIPKFFETELVGEKVSTRPS